MIEREKLVENMSTLLPFMFKRLIKGLPAFELPKQQLALLFHIRKENAKPMTYYSEKMSISKPNLTVMADKLIEEGYLERSFDPSDRRIIILKITRKGEIYLEEQINKFKQATLEKLEQVADNDVKRLNELIEEMRTIFNKIDQT